MSILNMHFVNLTRGDWVLKWHVLSIGLIDYKDIFDYLINVTFGQI